MSQDHSRISSDDLNDFLAEASELLDDAETHLLALDREEPLNAHYAPIFRAFHSLKGAAGMLEFTGLQSHLHKLETELQKVKDRDRLSRTECTYFMKGLDRSRELLLPQALLGPQDQLEAESLKLESLDSATPPAAEIANPSAVVEKVSEPSGSGEHLVYVVDDEPDIVELIVDALSTQRQFTIRGFTRPSDLLSALKVRAPVMIVSDLNMPGMTGLELWSKIRPIYPELPFVLCSAYLDETALLEALRSGVFGAIRKPFQNVELLGTAMMAVQKSLVGKVLEDSINSLLIYLGSVDFSNRSLSVQDLGSRLKAEMRAILKARHAARQFQETLQK